MSELAFTQSGNDAEDRPIRQLANARHARQIVPWIYTSNLRDPPEAITRRNIWAILGTLHASGRFPTAGRPQ